MVSRSFYIVAFKFQEITCSSQHIFPMYCYLSSLFQFCFPAKTFLSISACSNHTLPSRPGLNIFFSTEFSSVTFSTPSIPAKSGSDLSFLLITVLFYLWIFLLSILSKVDGYGAVYPWFFPTSLNLPLGFFTLLSSFLSLPLKNCFLGFYP